MEKSTPSTHYQALRFLEKKYSVSFAEADYVIGRFIGWHAFHQHVQAGKTVKVPKIGAFTFSSHKSRYRKKRREKNKKARKKFANMIERMNYRRETKNFQDHTDFF